MKYALILPVILFLAFSACQGNEPKPQTPKQLPDTLPGYRRVDVRSAVTQVQPMTGLVMWPSHSKIDAYKDAISLEYSYCLPCRVVTGKQDGNIQYDWKYFEDILNDIASRQHQAIIRFRYEYPSSKQVDGNRGTTAVPQYIKDLPDYHETYNADAGGDGPTYYADWSNQELQWFTKQFYTDFAARYNEDPRIAFLEVGFGHWSEYHIYGTKLQLGINFPSKAYQTDFLSHIDSVITIPWAISIDAADGDYTPIVASKQLMELRFGLFDDSFMHKDHQGYNASCWKSIGQGTRWKRGVCGGEISYYTSKDQKNFLNPEGMYGRTWENEAASYHITFMIANDAPGSTYGSIERFQEAGLATGYHYQVLGCYSNDSVTRIKLTNTGIAPIYYDAYFALRDTLSNTDILSATSLRYVLPKDTLWITIPCSFSSNKQLSISCSQLLPTQHIAYQAE